jgi:hypothetical protein
MKMLFVRGRILLMHHIVISIVFSLIFISLSIGCKSDKHATSKTVLAFKEETQSRLDKYTQPLARSLVINDRNDINSKLKSLYSEPVTSVNANNLFVAVLDNHGVTVASQSPGENAGAQNYGHYHIVTRVLQKQKVLQSSLYLQGDRKVFIICAPLQYRKKLAGALVMGIDAEKMLQAGIPEKNFMYIDFSRHPVNPDS